MDEYPPEFSQPQPEPELGPEMLELLVGFDHRLLMGKTVTRVHLRRADHQEYGMALAVIFEIEDGEPWWMVTRVNKAGRLVQSTDLPDVDDWPWENPLPFPFPKRRASRFLDEEDTGGWDIPDDK